MGKWVTWCLAGQWFAIAGLGVAVVNEFRLRYFFNAASCKFFLLRNHRGKCLIKERKLQRGLDGSQGCQFGLFKAKFQKFAFFEVVWQ